MRSISQIYSEAISKRNKYLQLTEHNSGWSQSKLSIMNLITYVASACIFTYESILDLFQIRLTETLVGRINGTPDWYAMMAKKFQYNDIGQINDQMRFNEDTMKIEYVTPDESRRIITQSSWQTNEYNSIVLKVCKDNKTGSVSNGVPYTPLSNSEITAFRRFIDSIKFVGAVVYCESMPGDIVTITASESAPIFYDDNYITANQALENIKASMIAFVNSFKFNEYIYFQDFVDVLQKTEHISYISKDVKVMVKPYNYRHDTYDEQYELTGRARLKSGFMTLLDENSQSTINLSNITLIPASQVSNYDL